MNTRTVRCESCGVEVALVAIRHKDLQDAEGNCVTAWICGECDQADPTEVGLSELELERIKSARFAGGW